ncbi:methyltransferase domain-containing protein [Brevundimonas sp. 2R-24]|uniref:Methyltransferase domain-containing protein n=1 Tax=Peiella sedimenti TaxID=3061083 RepID=A0ABT8SJP0_9CAUL|nr:methyltransferase domain-containing protein [Caulobacteraceae bacterium XZ-24]
MMFKAAVLAGALALFSAQETPPEGWAPPPPGPYSMPVMDSRRPAADMERDALRRPTEILAFAQIMPGQRIADIRPGAGYFTRLFSVAVGDRGHVYAFLPDKTAARDATRIQPVLEAYGNVTSVTAPLEEMSFDQPLDLIFVSQEYHDFHLGFFGTDLARFNAAAFRALKPGGVYLIIDHQARPRSGIADAETLHRIEGDFLRREVEAAGFVFESESRALHNPADDHSLNVFDAAIRGRTDQFVYRFRKPE